MRDVFKDPVWSDISWQDIQTALLALGCEMKEGNGSRVRFTWNEVRATFHRPHPERVTDKGAVKSVRAYLLNAGFDPDEL